jgi:hypothetical protein
VGSGTVLMMDTWHYIFVQTPRNLTAQKVNLKVPNKNYLGGRRWQDGMKNVIKQSNYITNIWENSPEVGKKKDAVLSSFRNEWSLWDKRQKKLHETVYFSW